MYPRPIPRKETGGSLVVDPAQKRARAYTDRAPTLTEGESIDPPGKINPSAIPSSNARSRGLSRSNAFRADTPPSMDVDRARILAFREASMKIERSQDANLVRERSQTATLSRGKYNNRKRTNSRFAANQGTQTRGMTVPGTAVGSRSHTMSALGRGDPKSSHPPLPRLETPRLAKLNTDTEVSLQDRRAGARGGMLGLEQHHAEHFALSHTSKVPAMVDSHPTGTSRFREEFSP